MERKIAVLFPRISWKQPAKVCRILNDAKRENRHWWKGSKQECAINFSSFFPRSRKPNGLLLWETDGQMSLPLLSRKCVLSYSNISAPPSSESALSPMSYDIWKRAALSILNISLADHISSQIPLVLTVVPVIRVFLCVLATQRYMGVTLLVLRSSTKRQAFWWFPNGGNNCINFYFSIQRLWRCRWESPGFDFGYAEAEYSFKEKSRRS